MQAFKVSGEEKGHFLSRYLYDMLEFPWKDVGTDEGKNWALVRIDPHPDSGKQIKGDNRIVGRISGKATIHWLENGESQELEYDWVEPLIKVGSSVGIQVDPFQSESLFICKLIPEEIKNLPFERKLIEKRSYTYFFPAEWNDVILQTWTSLVQSNTNQVEEIVSHENPLVAVAGIATRQPTMNEWLDCLKSREKGTGKNKESWIVEAAYYLGAFRSRQGENLGQLSEKMRDSTGDKKEYLASAICAAMGYGLLSRNETLQLINETIKDGETIPEKHKSLNSLKRLKESESKQQ